MKKLLLILCFLLLSSPCFGVDYTNPANGCVAAWLHDGTSGTSEDSCESEDGTLRNGTTEGTTGKFDEAYTFDGSNDCVDTDFNPSISEGTIVLWLKNSQASHSADDWVIGRNGAGDNAGDFGLFLENGNAEKFQFFIQTGSGTVNVVSNSAFSSDQDWHHVAVQWDSDGGAGSMKMWVDGTQQTDTDTQVSMASHASLEIAVGTQQVSGSTCNFTGGSWQGELDEVAIFDVLLTGSQINDIMNNGLAAASRNRMIIIQ